MRGDKQNRSDEHNMRGDAKRLMGLSRGLRLQLRRWRWLLAVPPLLALGACVQAPLQPPVETLPQGQAPQAQPAPAPAVAPQAAANAETLKALAELTELKEELKKLRNAVEEIQFARSFEQNFLQDLDRRLLSVEREQRLRTPQPQQPLQPQPPQQPVTDDATDLGLVPVPDPGATPPAPPADVAVVVPDGSLPTPPIGEDAPPAPPKSVSVQEQEAYDQALNLLKQSRYQDAINEFQRLADTWPDGLLADDAYYWMSEARYVNREYEAALGGFRTVETRYPDSQRVPEALLKVGYIQYDIGAYKEAAEIFRDVLSRFPGHQVAVSAQTRLRRIENTIQ